MNIPYFTKFQVKLDITYFFIYAKDLFFIFLLIGYFRSFSTLLWTILRTYCAVKSTSRHIKHSVRFLNDSDLLIGSFLSAYPYENNGVTECRANRTLLKPVYHGDTSFVFWGLGIGNKARSSLLSVVGRGFHIYVPYDRGRPLSQVFALDKWGHLDVTKTCFWY